MDESYGGRFDRTAPRSRSRSPFRRNFQDRPNENRRIKRKTNEPTGIAKHRVYVTNIPYECKWMELKDLFREKVGDVIFVELYDDEKGKNAGTGVVEFKDAETAEKAINIMHKHELRGRFLNVKEGTEAEKARNRGFSQRGPDRDRRDMDFASEFRREPSFNTYGLNPEFLKSIGITGPLSTKLFISNLDYKVTEKKLEEIFKLAGKVLSCDLSVDTEGKSKGHAVAEMEHPLEAVQVISMFSGQRLYARNMHVRMDRFADDESPSKLPSGLHGIGKGLGANGLPMAFSKNMSSSNGGNFGVGIGGSMGGGSGLSLGGMGSSGLGMSPNMGMSSERSMGMSNSERNMMSGSSMSMGGGGGGASSSLFGSSSMGLSSSMMDVGLSRDRDFPLSAGKSVLGFGDTFDRGGDSFSNATDTLVLGNLSNNFTWQMLKDRFRDIGDVRFAEMKNPNTALIRFASMQDAQHAMDLMNGAQFEGRRLQIRFY